MPENTNAEDAYIFREKIRHPSNPNEWIIARDYAQTDEQSTIFESKTGAITQFNLNSHSYNYNKIENQDVWVNSVDAINSNSIDIANIVPAPPSNDTTLLGDITITTTAAEAIDFNFTDILQTTTVAGIYNGNTNTINLTPTTGQTMPSLIPTAITTVTNVECIVDDDIVIIPNFKDNNLSLNVYEYSSQLEVISPTTQESVTPSAYKTLEFEYNAAENKDVLNIMKTDSNYNNHISFQQIINQLTPVSSINIDVTGGNYVIVNDFPVTGLYGNGTILRRYQYTGFSAIPEFDYHWLICNDGLKNYLIAFTDNYIIAYWYEVTLSAIDDDIYIQRVFTKDINNIDVDFTPITYSLGWNSSSTINFTNYPHLNPSAYAYTVATDLALNFQYQDDNDRKIKIFTDTITPSALLINRQDTNQIGVNNSVAVTSFTNNNTLSNITTLSKGSSDNIYNYVVDSASKFQININTNGASTLTFLLITNNTLNARFLWTEILDTMIINEPTIPISQLYFLMCLANIKGNISYETTVLNACRLTKKTQINNVAYGNTINNLWSLIRWRDINISPQFPYIYLEYSNTIKGKLIYYTTDGIINDSLSPYGKRIWFIQTDSQNIINTDQENTYFVNKNTLNIPTQFKNLIADKYTNIEVSIQNNTDITPIDITYNWHQYQTTIRYYGADNQLLNVGNQYTPVYIKNGQFYPCVGLNDVEVSSIDPTQNVDSVEIWIDPTVS